MNKPYKVKGREVDSQNTVSPYGLDIEDKLSKMLSEELAKSIDAQILQTIINQGRPMMRKDKIKSILKKIRLTKVN